MRDDDPLNKEAANYAPEAKSGQKSVFCKYSFIETQTCLLTHILSTILSCFHATRAELNHCNKNSMSYKKYNIFYLVLSRKKLADL